MIRYLAGRLLISGRCSYITIIIIIILAMYIGYILNYFYHIEWYMYKWTGTCTSPVIHVPVDWYMYQWSDRCTTILVRVYNFFQTTQILNND
ncbi:unnamed protein product, partial [Linum tenue]